MSLRDRPGDLPKMLRHPRGVFLDQNWKNLLKTKKKQMVERFDRSSKGFRCTWVVGDRGSGKTQMLTDICLTLIKKGQKR